MYLTPAGQWMSMHIPEGWFGRKMETEKESEMTGMWMWKRRFELLPFTRKRCHSEWLHCCLRKMKLCRGLDSGNTNTDSNGKTEITNPRMRGTRAEGIPKVTKQCAHENFTSQTKKKPFGYYFTWSSYFIGRAFRASFEEYTFKTLTRKSDILNGKVMSGKGKFRRNSEPSYSMKCCFETKWRRIICANNLGEIHGLVLSESL